MNVRFWGVRGSVPLPGAAAAGYGGNTSCVQVTAGDGTEIVLDAGTGIRELGGALAGKARRVHILLTHLHLDHIQGLLFFAPFFDPSVEVTVWGPPAASIPLRERLARYMSTPLSPVEIRELPARVSFEDSSEGPWRIGSVEVEADLVSHRGPTLGYRLAEDGASLVYLPDHEPALGTSLDATPRDWVSGLGLASRTSLIIHDAQYTAPEYLAHVGWGHSSTTDALLYARRAEAERIMLTHHDPNHDDARLDEVAAETREQWVDLQGGAEQVGLAREGATVDLS